MLVRLFSASGHLPTGPAPFAPRWAAAKAALASKLERVIEQKQVRARGVRWLRCLARALHHGALRGRRRAGGPLCCRLTRKQRAHHPSPTPAAASCGHSRGTRRAGATPQRRRRRARNRRAAAGAAPREQQRRAAAFVGWGELTLLACKLIKCNGGAQPACACCRGAEPKSNHGPVPAPAPNPPFAPHLRAQPPCCFPRNPFNCNHPRPVQATPAPLAGTIRLHTLKLCSLCSLCVKKSF